MTTLEDEAMHKRMILIIAAVLMILAAFGPGCGRSFSNPADSEDDMIKSGNYSNGRFSNFEPTNVMKPGTVWNTSYQYMFGGHDDRTPPHPLPLALENQFASMPPSTGLRFIWLGHSSVYVELGGRRILIDPMLSERASFLSWAGPKRFQPAAHQARDLPHIDAVLISHDHYDHLDKATIVALAGKTATFHVPLKVGAILETWGIPKAKIREYAWWDEYGTEGMMIAATPARHFSGRGLFDRNKTLWCSWVVSCEGRKVFHSGDTGMTSQLHEIGEKYGPFDLAFIKIAAYHENWPDIHLTPEQALEACRDVGCKALVPIHWGTFDMALHSWYEPIERLVKSAQTEKTRTITPMMGELVDPDRYENGFWWREPHVK